MNSLAFAIMLRGKAREGVAKDDGGEAHRAKSGGFGTVPLGFATDAPRGSAGSFTLGWFQRGFTPVKNAP